MTDAAIVVTPAVELRLRLLGALESAGFVFDPDTHVRYLRGCRAVAEPFAAEIIELLEARGYPQTDTEYSLFAAVDTMSAFACAATDHLYRQAAAGTAYRDHVRRGLSVFVVGSAILDQICDHEPALLEVVRQRVSARWIRAALDGRAPGDPLAGSGQGGLPAYLGALLAEAARIWARLAALDHGPRVRPLRRIWSEGLGAACRAELRSTATLEWEAGCLTQDAALIWSMPFWMALRLIAMTPDAWPGIALDALSATAVATGRLLSLLDDVADLEDDWASGSRNQYLHLAGIPAAGRRRPGEIPWDALLAEEVSATYLGEVTRLLAAVSGSGDHQRLAAWLYYWLGP
jgi:hypothetical protein